MCISAGTFFIIHQYIDVLYIHKRLIIDLQGLHDYT